MSTTPHSAHPHHDPEAALIKLGITLPTPVPPVAAYIPTKRVGNLLFVSGQLPMKDGKLIATGAVPSQVSLETARDCARQCCINGLAAARAAMGNSLSKVRGVVRVGCFVASDTGFGDQPKIANACSELLVEVFGDAGKHARAAVGTNTLPLNVPVEIEFTFEVE